MDGRKGGLISHITPLRIQSIEAWTPKYSIYHGCMMLTVLLNLHLFLCSQTKDGAGRYGRSLPEHTGYVYVRPAAELSVVTVHRRPVVVSLFLTSRQSTKFGVVIELHLSRCTVMVNPFCWPALKLPLPSLPFLPLSVSKHSVHVAVFHFFHVVFVAQFVHPVLTVWPVFTEALNHGQLLPPPPPPTHPDLISFFGSTILSVQKSGVSHFLSVSFCYAELEKRNSSLEEQLQAAENARLVQTDSK